MKIKKYLFCIAIGITACVFGLNIVNVAQYFQSVYQTNNEKAELTAPLEIQTIRYEDLLYPPRGINLAENFIINETPANTETEDKSAYEFDAEGEYYLIGDLPEGFKDFDTLGIETRNYENVSEENDWKGVPIPPEGFVLTKKKFKFVRINIANREISFETESKKGISYKFTGKFIDAEEIKFDDYSEYIVLKGRLTKLRDGKKIAESEVKFAESHGC